MSFLAPLFLLGGLAVALPILFHLIRRTPIIQRHFSSLMFLNPSPPQLSRRSRLDKILLLLLRCLIIGLLAMAFARPFLRNRLPAHAGEAPQKIAFVLVDASASMQRSALWPDAVARAREIARAAGPADRVQIAVFDRVVRRVLSFDEWSALAPQDRAAEVSRRLASAAPTSQPGDVGAALMYAAEELDSLGQHQPGTRHQIVVISDLQEGNRTQGLQGFDWPKGLEVGFEPVRAKNPNNAGLHLAAESEGAPASAAEARPVVRISNASESKQEQFRLIWTGRDGARVGAAVDVHVPAGKTRVVRAPQRPAGSAELQLTLSGDEEPFDNTLYIAAPEPERVEVGYMGAGGEDDPAELFYYLRRAFQETRRRTVALVALPPNSESVPAGVRFVIASGDISAAQRAALKKHIDQGNNALYVMKDSRAAVALAQLLDVPEVETSEAALQQYAMLEQIDFAHPIFAPFADPRFSDFRRIHFWKHRRVATNGLSAARALARFDNGAPALIETALGRGQLLVLTSGWHPGDSQLALSSKFVPLLYSMLEYSGCFKERSSALLAGSDLPARPGLALRKPDGSELAAERGRWVLEVPGLYTASEGGATYKLAVNLEPAESKTTPIEAEDFLKLGVPIRSAHAPPAASVERERKRAHATELESRQKLWRWLIAGALAIVLAETWLAARLSRPVAIEAA